MLVVYSVISWVAVFMFYSVIESTYTRHLITATFSLLVYPTIHRKRNDCLARAGITGSEEST
jgi:hypothetical protein